MEAGISGQEGIKRIEEYIKNQQQQDQIADWMNLKEFAAPFTDDKNTKT